MAIIHGENCECCKNLSIEAKRALIEIDNFTLGKGSVFSEKETIQQQLEKINQQLKPVGGIDDIVALAKRFFAIDFDSLNIANLEPLPEKGKIATIEEKVAARNSAMNKKVGKFRISDLTDNPFIDPTRIIDFQGLDLSSLSKIKISLTVPTLVVVKELSFGPVKLGIKFFISLKEISWTPDIEKDFDTIEKAIKVLKKSVTTNLVTPSMGKPIITLKKLANEQLKNTNPSANNDLQSAISTEDFFAKLGTHSLNIYETVNVGDEAERILNSSKRVENLIREVENSDSGKKLVQNANDLAELASCEPRRPVLAQFREEEISEVIPCAVEKNEARPLDIQVNTELQDIRNLLATIPTANDAETEKQKLDEFLGKVESHNQIMQNCAQEKLKAINRYYFFQELNALHFYTHTYLTQRVSALGAYAAPYITIFQERDRLLQTRAKIAANIVKLESEISSTVVSTEDSTLTSSESNVAPSMYTPIEPNQLPANVTTISGGFYATNTFSDVQYPGIVAKQELINKNIQEYNLATQAIQAENSRFNENIATQFQGIRAELDALPSSGNPSDDIFSNGGINLGAAVQKIRAQLNYKLNPISNLTGFSDNGSFVAYVNSDILEDAKRIYEKALEAAPSYVNPPTINGQVLFSGATQILEDYIQNLNFTFDPIPGEEKIRTGVLETSVWKKYYSPQRIDELFTWEEQGYTAPKPVYDNTGNALGTVEKVEIVNGAGAQIVQEVPTTVKDCLVNLQVAVPFLDNIETNTKSKILQLIDEIQKGPDSNAYTEKVKTLATLEAKLFYYNFFSNINFNDSVSVFELSVPQEFERSYTISKSIFQGIEDEILAIEQLIQGHTECVKTQQTAIENAGIAYAKSVSPNTQPEANSNSIAKKCKNKLGSDPVGLQPSTNECPNFTKNCYWEEYTKLLQIVSLMPIPELDPNNFSKRLFRYYPVALQVPLPVPPGILPTLAAGVPDPLISVPLPFLWKHVVTITTPFGVFVIWIALAGGFLPNPFIMFIDEKNNTMFLVSPKGPTNLPASQLNFSQTDRTSLLDFINFKKALQISFNSVLGKLITGSTRGNPLDPDDPSTIIDKIKSKISKSLDDLTIPDPSFAGKSDRAKEIQKRIKDALEFIPPDIGTIDEVFTEIFQIASDSVDELRISGIQIPKNSKYLISEIPPLAELLETFQGLIDQALSAPNDIAEKVLGDIGAGVKTFNVKEKINQLTRKEADKSAFREALQRIDGKINALEDSIAESETLSAEAAAKRKEAILKRSLIIRDMIKEALQNVADNITPELLGFTTTVSQPLPLPIPCYTNLALPPLPPWVLAAIGLIKQAPSIIDSIPLEQIANLLGDILNLEFPLPRAEQLFYLAINKVLGFLPELILPVGFDTTILKQIKDSLKNWLLTYKLRLPKPGLPAPLVIPASLIKGIIKEAIGIFLQGLKAILLTKLSEVANAAGPERVAKVFAILALIKLLFGVNADQITGADIKAFLRAILESVVYPPLDAVKGLIQAATALISEFKSIKDVFISPDPFSLLGDEPPYFEIGAEQLRNFVDQILVTVVANASENLPFPAILLGCSFTPTRAALTKIHPTIVWDKLPRWEGLTLKNIPYVIWLDTLVASAQRYSFIGSDYVAPYFTPPTL